MSSAQDRLQDSAEDFKTAVERLRQIQGLDAKRWRLFVDREAKGIRQCLGQSSRSSNLPSSTQELLYYEEVGQLLANSLLEVTLEPVSVSTSPYLQAMMEHCHQLLQCWKHVAADQATALHAARQEEQRAAAAMKALQEEVQHWRDKASTFAAALGALRNKAQQQQQQQQPLDLMPHLQASDTLPSWLQSPARNAAPKAAACPAGATVTVKVEGNAAEQGARDAHVLGVGGGSSVSPGGRTNVLVAVGRDGPRLVGGGDRAARDGVSMCSSTGSTPGSATVGAAGAGQGDVHTARGAAVPGAVVATPAAAAPDGGGVKVQLRGAGGAGVRCIKVHQPLPTLRPSTRTDAQRIAATKAWLAKASGAAGAGPDGRAAAPGAAAGAAAGPSTGPAGRSAAGAAACDASAQPPAGRPPLPSGDAATAPKAARSLFVGAGSQRGADDAQARGPANRTPSACATGGRSPRDEDVTRDAAPCVAPQPQPPPAPAAAAQPPLPAQPTGSDSVLLGSVVTSHRHSRYAVVVVGGGRPAGGSACASPGERSVTGSRHSTPNKSHATGPVLAAAAAVVARLPGGAGGHPPRSAAGAERTAEGVVAPPLPRAASTGARLSEGAPGGGAASGAVVDSDASGEATTTQPPSESGSPSPSPTGVAVLAAAAAAAASSSAAEPVPGSEQSALAGDTIASGVGAAAAVPEAVQPPPQRTRQDTTAPAAAAAADTSVIALLTAQQALSTITEESSILKGSPSSCGDEQAASQGPARPTLLADCASSAQAASAAAATVGSASDARPSGREAARAEAARAEAAQADAPQADAACTSPVTVTVGGAPTPGEGDEDGADASPVKGRDSHKGAQAPKQPSPGGSQAPAAQGGPDAGRGAAQGGGGGTEAAAPRGVFSLGEMLSICTDILESKDADNQRRDAEGLPHCSLAQHLCHAYLPAYLKPGAQPLGQQIARVMEMMERGFATHAAAQPLVALVHRVLRHGATEGFALQQLRRYQAARDAALRLRRAGAAAAAAAASAAAAQQEGGAGCAEVAAAPTDAAASEEVLLASPDPISDAEFAAVLRRFYRDTPERLAGLARWQAWVRHERPALMALLNTLLQVELEQHAGRMAEFAPHLAACDPGRTGVLDARAFAEFCANFNAGMTSEEVLELFGELDATGSGVVTVTAVAEAALQARERAAACDA